MHPSLAEALVKAKQQDYRRRAAQWQRYALTRDSQPGRHPVRRVVAKAALWVARNTAPEVVPAAQPRMRTAPQVDC